MSAIAETLKRFATNSSGLGIELIYTCHPRWPLVPESLRSDGGNGNDGTPLALSVLDSSFNPPTMAHLALARLPLSAVPAAPTRDPTAAGAGAPLPLPRFDAKLLLFSTRNADKTAQPGDATPAQRLEMMVCLARALQAQAQAQDTPHGGDVGSQNVAVALCRAPAFVDKAPLLRRFLHARIAALGPPSPVPAPADTHTDAHAHGRGVRLTFLMGLDTLERLFAPRYYGDGDDAAMARALRRFFAPSAVDGDGDGDGARVLCARRSAGASYTGEADGAHPDTGAGAGIGLLARVAADTGLELGTGAVQLVDIGRVERVLSSREVREAIWRGGAWEEKVPGEVAAYIKEHQVYGKSDSL